MANAKDFVKNNEFGGDATKFPEGKTVINLEETEIIPSTYTDPESGKTKPRWKIKTKDATYYGGVQIMSGMKEAVEKGASKVEIVRDGSGLKTSYIVIPA